MRFRAINWRADSSECDLLSLDRHVMAGRPSFVEDAASTYFEKNCVEDPSTKRLCIYETVKGKILKTVDSVYQARSPFLDLAGFFLAVPLRI